MNIAAPSATPTAAPNPALASSAAAALTTARAELVAFRDNASIDFPGWNDRPSRDLQPGELERFTAALGHARAGLTALDFGLTAASQSGLLGPYMAQEVSEAQTGATALGQLAGYVQAMVDMKQTPSNQTAHQTLMDQSHVSIAIAGVLDDALHAAAADGQPTI